MKRLCENQIAAIFQPVLDERDRMEGSVQEPAFAGLNRTLRAVRRRVFCCPHG